jgi:hypothetical protein
MAEHIWRRLLSLSSETIQVETAVGRATIAIQEFEPGTRRLPRCDGGGRGLLVSDAQTGRDLALGDLPGVIRAKSRIAVMLAK